ncbi:hypothetical protein CVS52_03825 [Staphylococcus epidermidis]|nr:hypothetical protein CVS52_03825 [Staphylococcus epidermidis]
MANTLNYYYFVNIDICNEYPAQDRYLM